MPSNIGPFDRSVYCQGETFNIRHLIGKGSSKEAYLATNTLGKQIAAVYQKIMNDEQARREFYNLHKCKGMPGVIQLLERPDFFAKQMGPVIFGY